MDGFSEQQVGPKGGEMVRKTGFMFVASLFLAVLLGSVLAKEPRALWTRTYGGYDNDRGHCMVEASDGGYIIAGMTHSFGAGSLDAYAVRIGPMGDTLWTRAYGGSDRDEAYSVAEAPGGGYLIAGLTYSFGAELSDVYIIRTDSSGDTLWTRTFGGPGLDIAVSVAATSDSGFVVTGGGASWATDISGCTYLMKLSPDGDSLWTRLFRHNTGTYGFCVRQCSDGGFVLAGRTYPSWDNSDVCILKTDPSGHELWSRSYGGPDNDLVYSVVEVPDSGFALVGYTTSFGAGDGDMYFLRTDPSGDTLWTRTYGGIYPDYGYSIRQTTDNGYILAGFSCSFTASWSDGYLVRTDARGDTLWTRTFGGYATDLFMAAIPTPDGGCAALGSTESFGLADPARGDGDVWLVRVRGRGWAAHEGELADPENPIEGKHVVAWDGLSSDPVSGGAVLRYTLAKPQGVRLTIHSVSGALVRTIWNCESQAGTHSSTWDGTNAAGHKVATGIYFARLVTENEVLTTKVVVLR